MSRQMTRRGFLRTGAASAVLASAGAIGMTGCGAQREELTGEAKRTATLCNGCSNECGLWVNTVGGKVHTLEGNPDNPKSGGRMCGRGHGFAQMTYSADRLTQPMKRMENGDFEPIS